jgi:hypothetical protein
MSTSEGVRSAIPTPTRFICRQILVAIDGWPTADEAVPRGGAGAVPGRPASRSDEPLSAWR